jgi:hypothetical protein
MTVDAGQRYAATLKFAATNHMQPRDLVVFERDGVKLARVVDHDWHETAWTCRLVAVWDHERQIWIPSQ